MREYHGYHAAPDRPMHADAKKIVERFALAPHPEGGYFREVYRSALTIDHPAVGRHVNPRRSAGTFIYFLLAAGDFSAFHRVLASDEIWHWYAGGPLEVHTLDAVRGHATQLLTNDLTRGEPTCVVPGNHWQATRLAPGADWALAGCTVSPGFDFADFEMPPAAELIAVYPGHERIIRQLTKR